MFDRPFAVSKPLELTARGRTANSAQTASMIETTLAGSVTTTVIVTVCEE
jgi:hypothetical protein